MKSDKNGENVRFGADRNVKSDKNVKNVRFGAGRDVKSALIQFAGGDEGHDKAHEAYAQYGVEDVGGF